MNLLASIMAFLFLVTLQLLAILFVSKLSCLNKITNAIGRNAQGGKVISQGGHRNEWSSIDLLEDEITLLQQGKLKMAN